MSLKLDQNGNIRPEYLEKELQSALEMDIKYQQTDNMKKRAIKVAQSYDEFKNMVACAHLKTLSRQEIDSLKDVKRGWKKKHESSVESSVLQSELLSAPVGSVPQPSTFKAPKNSMALERDWRRLKTDEAKYEYLTKLGLKKAVRALRSDASAELLEQIIITLLQANDETDLDRVAWLTSITQFDRFALNVHFFDATLTLQVVSFLESVGEEEIASKYRL